MKRNVATLTDSYKVTHGPQYPKGTEYVKSHFLSRGGKFSNTVFFGLQEIILKHLAGRVVTEEGIEEAKMIYDLHLGPNLFNEAAWNRLLQVHEGYLPIKIKAVPEGSVVPVNNVLLTVENTDPEFFWLTNWLETLLVQTWYPTTVATISHECKQLIGAYLKETGDPSLIDFKLHDFGFRGTSSVESAGMGGVAHLVNFMGTDTVPALLDARKYYDSEMAGFSIPAAEHSTITSWLRSGEVDAYDNMLDQFEDSPLIAVVADSYDIYHAAEHIWGEILRDKVMKRKGTVVIRPDSGDPVTVVTNLLEILGSKYPVSTNDKGYKVLDSHIRIIQGDGINYDSMGDILEAMKRRGWSADNITFGMGGGLLQDMNRDTQKFALKCNSVTVNGEERGVSKDPVTDPGKTSFMGQMKLVKLEGGHRWNFETVGIDDPREDQLNVVYENGTLWHHQDLDTIRKRVNSFSQF